MTVLLNSGSAMGRFSQQVIYGQGCIACEHETQPDLLLGDRTEKMESESNTPTRHRQK
jgi:hypothetical protein